jgi:lactoylglutathione lyase
MATPVTPVQGHAETSPQAGPRLQARALDHVNLHVRDADAALRFYTELFGLRVDRADRDAEGRATFVGLDAGAQRVFLVRRPEYEAPADPGARGLNHFCLEVEASDPERLLSDLRQRGIRLRSGLVPRQGVRGPTVSIYIEDPDGHGIEIMQRVARPAGA